MGLQFFNIVEGLQVGDRPILTAEHIHTEGKYVYMWFAEIFRIVQDSTSRVAAEKFSRNALLQSIREEPWCVRQEVRKPIGVSNVRRRCVQIEIDKAPEVIKNIVACCGGQIDG
jgi:hypothetical protein